MSIIYPYIYISQHIDIISCIYVYIYLPVVVFGFVFKG